MLGVLDMVKFAICNEIFEGWSLSRVMEYVASLGYDGLEIAPFTLCTDVREVSKKMRKQIAELATNFGLRIVGTHWLLVTPPGLHILHPDEKIRMRTLEYLKELVKFTYDIGGNIMVFGSPKQRNIPAGLSKSKALTIASNIFKECCKFAKDYNVIICIEPLSRDQTNFINTSKEAIELIKMVNYDNFRLILDVRSMFDEGVPHEVIIRE